MTTKTKLPRPLYAAAGAGDAVVEQLKKIPAVIDDLRGKAKVDERVETVRDGLKERFETLRNLDADTVKRTASEAAETLSEKAKEAREKAAETYADFIERGERVAAGERGPIKVIATITGKQDQEGSEPVEAELVTEEKPAKPAAKKTAKKTTKTTKKTA